MPIPSKRLKPGLPVAPRDVDGALLADLGLDPADAVFLGLDGRSPWFAIDIASASEAVHASCTAVGRFQSLGPIQDPIGGEAWSVPAQARALCTPATGYGVA